MLRAARLARREGVTFEGAVEVGRGVRVELARGARLALGDGCVLGAGTRVLVRGGEVRIGAGTHLGDDCRIVAHAGVTIGARCRLGPQAAIMDAEHQIRDPELPIRAQGLRAARVTIGDDVILGPGAVVLAGARVADGAVLGARTVTAGAMSASGAV
jgi:maltose O-acetyltransferase